LTQTTFAAEIPSAGSVIQQIPAARAPEKVAPELRIDSEEQSVAAEVDAVRIKVNSVQLVNARAFDHAELIAFTGFVPGSELTLAQLRELSTKITNYYRSRGYFLARAYLPAQDIIDGAIAITVVEGQFGNVVLRNESALADGVARRVIAGIDSGDMITIAPLESRLLQLGDLPGVKVKSTLVPGASVGASDLIVDVTNDQRVSGSIDLDNSGSRYTGAFRTGATVNVNNALGLGDVATLRALTSWEGLNYGRAAYQVHAGRADVGVAYTALEYELGREFESLKAHGTADIVSLYGRYPLVRSRNNSLYIQVGFDEKTFQDELDLTPQTVTDKKVKVAMTSLIGDHRDTFGGGGSSTYSLTWASGSLDLQSPAAAQIDAITARSNGHYDKLAFSVMRLQRVTETLSLYGALIGQLASGNLDISEKTGLGGASAVRAYPEGEAYVDQGYVVSLEARLALPTMFVGMPGHWQVIAFMDSGSGRASKDPWSTQRNRHTLSGGGLGLNWFDARSFALKASYAHTIGAAEATSAPDEDGRFWINAIKYF
jgi:hemolysin activation/secretion protein